MQAEVEGSRPAGAQREMPPIVAQWPVVPGSVPHGAAAMLESESPMHVAPPTADAVAADASTRRRRIAIAFGAMEAAGLGTAGCWASSQQQQHNTTSWSLSSSNEYD